MSWRLFSYKVSLKKRWVQLSTPFLMRVESLMLWMTPFSNVIVQNIYEVNEACFVSLHMSFS